MTVIIVIAVKAYTGRGTPLRGGLPSGHAAVAFAGWMAVTLILDDSSHRFLVSSLTFIMALLVAQTRVETGVHSAVRGRERRRARRARDARSSSRCSDDDGPIRTPSSSRAPTRPRRAPTRRTPRFHVGCAVLARDGRVIEGVNVENAAYPLGVCAERTALARAIAEGYRPGDFVAAAITASPCGGCRQWLLEMQVGRVVFRNGGRVVTMTPGRAPAGVVRLSNLPREAV